MQELERNPLGVPSLFENQHDISSNQEACQMHQTHEQMPDHIGPGRFNDFVPLLEPNSWHESGICTRVEVESHAMMKIIMQTLCILIDEPQALEMSIRTPALPQAN